MFFADFYCLSHPLKLEVVALTVDHSLDDPLEVAVSAVRVCGGEGRRRRPETSVWWLQCHIECFIARTLSRFRPPSVFVFVLSFTFLSLCRSSICHE